MILPKNSLFIIDAHALCYRAFFAVKGLATSKGQPTNAVFGFTNILRKILSDFEPQYMAVCFDSGKKTHRQEKYAEYKIQRPTMPQDLRDQIPIIKEVVKAYNLTIFELGGFEADDIIATLSKQASKKNRDVVIVSEDKDMYQLVDHCVKIFNPRKEVLLDEKALEEQLGFIPERIVDFIALAGDPSDNIPGVYGIGEVTAKKLIQDYGTLENIYANLDNLNEKIRIKLMKDRDNAVLSKELASLTVRVPFEMTFDDLKVTSADEQRLLKLFKELEFKKFVYELSSSDISMPLFDTPRNEGNIKEIIQKIKKTGEFIFMADREKKKDIECFKGLGIILDEEEIVFVSQEKIVALVELFRDKAIRKITYDLKMLLKFFYDLGVFQPSDNIFSEDFLIESWFDVMLAGYLLRPSQGAFSFSDLVWNFLKESKDAGNNISSALMSMKPLFRVMEPELQQKSLKELFEKIEIPLAYVLSQMERNGVCLDEELLRSLSQESEKALENLTAKIYQETGQEFNLNSPKQLSFILFEKLKLPAFKKTKTGFSTDEEVLNRLAVSYEIPRMLLEYRQITKLKSTYIDALPQLVNVKTKRIHARFNQTGTETGRLSSSHPNLQNIPIRTTLGRQVRRAIVPSKRNILLSADYSQIELRILAHLSKDETLMKAFIAKEDIHNYTASLIFDINEKEVTRQMRDAAKRVNFGIIYGMSHFGLAKDLGVSNNEAQEFIDKYFSRYPRVKEFMDAMIIFCEKNGFVTTLLNRRRYIPEIYSANNAIKQFAQRQAINTPVQGSAADLIKLAMINVARVFEKKSFKTQMIITVHDELVFDVTPEEKEEVIGIVKKEMENTIKLLVPVTVSVKVGKNWLDMDEVDA